VVSSRDLLSWLQWRPAAVVIWPFARPREGVDRSEQHEGASARIVRVRLDPARIDERIDPLTADFTHRPELAVRVRRSLGAVVGAALIVAFFDVLPPVCGALGPAAWALRPSPPTSSPSDPTSLRSSQVAQAARAAQAVAEPVQWKHRPL